MVLNGVELVSSQLDNISLDSCQIRSKMHPKTETATCEKNQPPRLQLTPSNVSKKDGSSNQGGNNPYLLKPQHDIPPTPPPQVDTKCENLFLQRIG